MAAAEPTVIVSDLHVVYRLRKVPAVRGVSFIAYEGDAIGVIGRNGSGKSTLMRAIAGLLPADGGAVYARGQPSLLGVNAAMMSNLTGERNVELGCLALGMTREQARAAYDDIVEFSGVGDFIKMPMKTYSSGMDARLRFAIAAAKTHDILLVDEALATGDRDFRRKSQERIQQLRREAGTVFLVSHSTTTIKETCNRAIWLEKGWIRMDGDADVVVDAYLAHES